MKIPTSTPSGIAQYQSGSVSACSPTPSTTAVTMNETSPNGNCSSRKVRSFQVAGSARRAAGAPSGRPRRHGPVRVRDRRSGQRADDAPLALGQPAPGVHRADQDRDADQGDRKPNAERDRRDEEDELERAEQAREQQVADPAVGARIEQLPPAGARSQDKSTGRRAARRYGKPHLVAPCPRWPRGVVCVIVAAAGALVVAVAPAGADRPTQRGTLTLSHRVDTSQRRLHRGLDLLSARAPRPPGGVAPLARGADPRPAAPARRAATGS